MKKKSLILDFDQSLENHLRQNFPQEIGEYRILHQALDARGANRGKKPQVHFDISYLPPGENFVETPLVFKKKKFKESVSSSQQGQIKPIIIGSGPAGLFCALRFAEYGIQTILLERGRAASERMKSIARFWRYNELDLNNNVCFGEGGAGLYSDGKLITRVKSPHIEYVMKTFVRYGAPEEVAYTANPHLGSNKIRTLIGKMTTDLTNLGHEVRYQAKVQRLIEKDASIIGVELENGEKLFSPYVILAVGHSAGDMYQHLHQMNVAMKRKDFAVGVRVEHPRRLLDQLQYGNFCQAPELGAARYRVSYHHKETDRGTYSFCMCPGGHVLSSGTEVDGLVVNGMSNYARNSPWSNAALVVSVKQELDLSDTSEQDSENLLKGLEYQRDIEVKAHQQSLKKATGREIPAIRMWDFLNEKSVSKDLPKTSCPSGIFSGNFSEIFPSVITDHLTIALKHFDRQIPGFIHKDALFLAPETRTSAPVTILRHPELLQSISHSGLYPAGEGAGYAGGITSAAVDGVKIAESILKQFAEDY